VAGEDEGTADEAGSEEGKEEKKGPATIEDALARAREVLADKGTMMAMVDDDDGDSDEEDADGGEEEEGGKEDEEEEAGEEEGGDDEAGADEEADESGDGDGDEKDESDGADEEGEDGDDKKPITVTVPGRQPDDEDIELEVEDQELAERIAHLKSGFLRGEEVREREIAMNASEDSMAELSQAFEVDPAGFVMQYTENKDELARVALALLTLPDVWEKISPQVDKLFTNEGELRTLQAEIKAERLEAKDKLTKRSEQRKENAENGRKLASAIDLMVPESLKESLRDQLIADLTRDTTDHISRNKLGKLDVKDLVPILASRLETNGIDPLDARKAILNGSRSRGKISTKKGLKKKPKTGQELAKASAKRKRAAAAPGPGKKAAPVQPTKLPAGQTIKERIAAARDKGIAAFLPEK
jgi:hypothetical protein